VPAAHSAGDAVLHLESSVLIVPFAAEFFENRASLNFLHTVTMPDIRIAAAEFYVNNAFGPSQARQQCYTATPDGGLRTLSGGQFSMQVGGSLATQENAAPPLLIEATHAVRDIRAMVGQPAVGYTIGVHVYQNGTPYCNLTIASGSTTSASVLSGANLPPLAEAATITMDVTLDVIEGFQGSISPGRDLTLTIRL
jgi:hypothetical protein